MSVVQNATELFDRIMCFCRPELPPAFEICNQRMIELAREIKDPQERIKKLEDEAKSKRKEVLISACDSFWRKAGSNDVPQLLAYLAALRAHSRKPLEMENVTVWLNEPIPLATKAEPIKRQMERDVPENHESREMLLHWQYIAKNGSLDDIIW